MTPTVLPTLCREPCASDEGNWLVTWQSAFASDAHLVSVAEVICAEGPAREVGTGELPRFGVSEPSGRFDEEKRRRFCSPRGQIRDQAEPNRRRSRTP